jgi:RNA polymerase sigma-70 factor, ECF subfamily
MFLLVLSQLRADVRQFHDERIWRNVTMDQNNWLTEQFEESRRHLRGVAYRILGSLAEADDAVQECWLRLSRSDAETVENLRGWLTTVVARVCIDMLRSRKSRREDAIEIDARMPAVRPGSKSDPEAEAILADSVGYATLVVLGRLTPSERITFVLHDLFEVPFEEIARITGRSPEAVRQLASRGRRRVRGVTTLPEKDLVHQRALVERFLTALRAGDPTMLMDVLDPEFVVHADSEAGGEKLSAGLRGAEAWAREAVQAARGARLARLAMVDQAVGLIVAPRGQLYRALRFTFRDGRVARLDVIGDPRSLQTIQIGVLAG